jgi:D-3-phosphoglycerate dehydrogenase
VPFYNVAARCIDLEIRLTAIILGKLTRRRTTWKEFKVHQGNQSSGKKLKVLITDYDYLDLQLEQDLYRKAGIEVATGQCRTEEDVIRAAEGCFGLLVQYAPINTKIFAARPEIRIVSRIGAGVDNVDTADAKRHRVWVANSPDYGIGEVATHALAMTLSLLRHLPWYDREVRQGNWNAYSTGKLRRAGKLTLGILGLGRIGKRMAHIGRNCFQRVIACDPYIIDGDFPAYVERVSLEQLFSQSDAISVHVPLTQETRGMVNGNLFKLMKPESLLVNTSRGPVVNVDDLLDALNAGRLEGAALDVLPVEPPPAEHPLLKHPRVIFTPHAAFYSDESLLELRRKAAQNLVDWACQGRPTYVVVAAEP